jgi:DNA invertase Pin-like site-specific DNA recombinase
MEGAATMTVNIAYLRVSTDRQDLRNQKDEIEKYTAQRGFQIDRWFEVELSSKRTLEERRITELVCD